MTNATSLREGASHCGICGRESPVALTREEYICSSCWREGEQEGVFPVAPNPCGPEDVESQAWMDYAQSLMQANRTKGRPVATGVWWYQSVSCKLSPTKHVVRHMAFVQERVNAVGRLTSNVWYKCGCLASISHVPPATPEVRL